MRVARRASIRLCRAFFFVDYRDRACSKTLLKAVEKHLFTSDFSHTQRRVADYHPIRVAAETPVRGGGPYYDIFLRGPVWTESTFCRPTTCRCLEVWYAMIDRPRALCERLENARIRILAARRSIVLGTRDDRTRYSVNVLLLLS